MEAYDRTSPDRRDRDYDELADWEQLAVDAVGRVIEFWGFKRNHGRVWALLYLRRSPLASSDLQEALELSKGAVSMITRDLVQWGVVDRRRSGGGRARTFVAEVDFLAMIRKVLRDRELSMIEEVEEDLEDAVRRADRSDAPDAILERLRRMKRLADMVRNALELFLSSARIDIANADDVL